MPGTGPRGGADDHAIIRPTPPVTATAPAALTRPLVRPLWTRVDAIAAALLFVFALAVRWPYLQLVPRFTDETADVRLALDMVRQGARPIVSLVDTYNGPLFHYLLAPGFAVGGDWRWPRVLVCLLGAGTVALTYCVGASIADLNWRSWRPAAARAAGVVGALVLGTAFIPVVVNSHIAWSNATSPFWVALCMLAALEAVRRDRPSWLVPTGLLAGVAQQTHPSVVAVLVGMAVWIALVRPAWLRTRWPWLALGAALLAVSNLIVYNALSGGGSLAGARVRDYAFTGGVTPSAWWSNLQGFLRLAYQMIGSTFLATINETTDPGPLAAALTRPGAVAAAALALIGVIYTARRAGVSAASWAAALLVLPFFNQAWHHYVLARYISPLWVPTAAAMGTGMVAWLTSGGSASTRAASAAGGRNGTLGRSRRIVAVAAALALGLVLTHNVIRLSEYYGGEVASGKTNARLLQLAPALAEMSPPGRSVLVDRDLRNQRTTAGGNVSGVLCGLLATYAVPCERADDDDLLEADDGTIVVLAPDRHAALGTTLRFEPVVFTFDLAPASPGDYAVYRVYRGRGGEASPR